MMLPVQQDGNPEQFRRKFRMYSETFLWLRETLWEYEHVKRRRCSRPRPPASQVVFGRRLLQTIDFLASNGSYTDLSFNWGKMINWKELLIEELTSMDNEYVK